MSARRIKTNKTTLYIVAIAVIIIAFLLLGGVHWTQGMMHGNRSMGMAHLNWVQIIISLGIGFVLGLLAGRRKW